MPERTLTARVENLERRMELLESLPERVSALELQIVHLRSEIRQQFSAVTGELLTQIEETRRHMRVLHEEVLSRLATIQEGLARRPRR